MIDLLATLLAGLAAAGAIAWAYTRAVNRRCERDEAIARMQRESVEARDVGLLAKRLDVLEVDHEGLKTRVNGIEHRRTLEQARPGVAGRLGGR